MNEQTFGWLMAALANVVFFAANMWMARRNNKHMDEIEEMQDYLRRTHQHLHSVDGGRERSRRDSGPGAA